MVGQRQQQQTIDLDALIPRAFTVRYRGREVTIRPPTLREVLVAWPEYQAYQEEAQAAGRKPSPRELNAVWMGLTSPFTVEEILDMPHVVYCQIEAQLALTRGGEGGSEGEDEDDEDGEEPG